MRKERRKEREGVKEREEKKKAGVTIELCAMVRHCHELQGIIYARALGDMGLW